MGFIAIRAIEKIYNFEIPWNIMVILNPKFVEKYFKSIEYLNHIKGAMWSNDLLSVYSYFKTKLKCHIMTKSCDSFNLDNGINNFLNTNIKATHLNNMNVLERLAQFFEKNQRQTKRMLTNTATKNLILAFTSKRYASDWLAVSLVNGMSQK